MTRFDLHGRVAMVTGCNKGLGQGLAVALAEAGGSRQLGDIRTRQPQPDPGHDLTGQQPLLEVVRGHLHGSRFLVEDGCPGRGQQRQPVAGR